MREARKCSQGSEATKHSVPKGLLCSRHMVLAHYKRGGSCLCIPRQQGRLQPWSLGKGPGARCALGFRLPHPVRAQSQWSTTPHLLFAVARSKQAQRLASRSLTAG